MTGVCASILAACAPRLAALADAATTGPTTKVDAPWFMSPNMVIVLMAAVMVVFFVFSRKAGAKTENARKDLLKNLKRGDKVVTIGGLLATVVDAREDEVVLKVDEANNTKMRFQRNAVYRVIVDEDKAETKAEKK